MNRKVVSGFVAVKVLENLAAAWFFGIYTIFLVSNGLSLFQANLVNMVFMITTTALDPFTGNLADRIGQKRVYFGGLLFWGAGTAMYGFGHGFWAFVAAEITAAVGHALMSEALESWLCNHVGNEETRKALAKASYWSSMARIPTALAGGWIGARCGLQWPWFLAGGSSIVALMMGWWRLRAIPERPAGYAVRPVPNVLVMAKEVWKNRRLRMMVGLFLLTSACFQPINMFWPIVLKGASGRSDWLGGVWIGVSLMAMAGARLSGKWKESCSGLALVLAILSVPMLFPVFFPGSVMPILGCFLIHEIGRGLWPLVFFNITNKYIDDHTRTTVNSIRSSLGTLGGAIGLPLFGFLSNYLSPTGVWLVAAMALLTLAAITWRQKE